MRGWRAALFVGPVLACVAAPAQQPVETHSARLMVQTGQSGLVTAPAKQLAATMVAMAEGIKP